MKEIKLAKRALELSMLISTKTVADAWFKYSGHCDVIEASYCPEPYRNWRDSENDLCSNVECISFCSATTLENLQYIVDCFEFIYAVAERKSDA